MIRRVLAVIVGLIVALAVANLILFISHAVWPPPFDVDLANPESVTTMIRTMSTGQFVVLLFSYAFGSLVAGWVMGKIARSRNPIAPLIVGILLTAFWVLFNLDFPYPTWVIIVGLFMYIPFLFLGIGFAVTEERRAVKDETEGEASEEDDQGVGAAADGAEGAGAEASGEEE